jgi:ubiquitin C-terminal hydrolase
MSALDLQVLLDTVWDAQPLDGSNQYQCLSCNGLRNGRMYTRIALLPPVLILTIMRFTYDAAVRPHRHGLTISRVRESSSHTMCIALNALRFRGTIMASEKG